MKIRVPEYFQDFRCIADKCLDSCCIGWEIDIDAESKAKYSRLDCELGREIVNKTSDGFFPLEANGRCAFLDKNGLCRIISKLGEGYLCDICREHPRYYGIGKDGIEGGLGLGCEEAARLILASGGEVSFTEEERSPKYFSEDEYADTSDRIRELIYGKIRRLGACELIGFMLGLAPVADGIAFDVSAGLEVGELPEISTDTPENAIEYLFAFLEMLGECEAMESSWRELVTRAGSVSLLDITKHEKEIKSLIFYFTHRYVRECVEDMTLGQRVLFSLLSALTVVALSGVINTDDPTVRAAVAFSKNIEYSTDNVDMILDRLSDIL